MKKREENKFWIGLIKIQRFVIIVTGAGTTLVVGGAMILREVAGINFIGFEEILLMVAFWLYMIGCGHGAYEKSQITADIITVMMKECLAKDIINLLKSIIYAGLAIVLMVWAFLLAKWSVDMGTVTAVFRVPVWVGQGSIFFGMVLTSFYSTVYMYDEMKSFYTKHISKHRHASGSDLDEAKGV